MPIFFYSVQPLKGQRGFEEAAFRLQSGRDSEARNMPQVREFEGDSLSRRNVRCFGTLDKEI